jgi:hypothetical protein
MSERADNLEAIHQLLAVLGNKLTAVQYLAILPDGGSAALFLQHVPQQASPPSSSVSLQRQQE